MNRKKRRRGIPRITKDSHAVSVEKEEEVEEKRIGELVG